MVDLRFKAVVDDLKSVLAETSAQADPDVLRKLVEDSSAELQANVAEEAKQKELQEASAEVLGFAVLSLSLLACWFCQDAVDLSHAKALKLSYLGLCLQFGFDIVSI